MSLSKEQASLGPAVFNSPRGTCIIMTGKAGTGKTFTINETFQHTRGVLRIAPTGLAASLIEGVTIDRMIPLMHVGEYWNPDLPTYKWKDELFEKYGKFERDSNGQVKRYKKGFQKGNPQPNGSVARRFLPYRYEVLSAVSFLIVDEPYMIRCDKIDCLDRCLRIAKKEPHTPFGGVTVVFAGDPAQFGPVIVNDEEKGVNDEQELTDRGYRAPFGFLQAKVFEKLQPIHIRLSKIFRQESKVDGNLLIRVATGTSTPSDLSRLNENVRDKAPFDSIVLTTNNYRANQWNNQQLLKCSGQPFSFRAEKTGTAKKKSFKLPEVLDLRIGCRVVIKTNDSFQKDTFKIEYVNGDQGIFLGVDKHDRLMIERFRDKEIVHVKRFSVYENKAKKTLDGDIRIEQVGEFKQYPVKLGYASTAHSAQGQTLHRVHIYLEKNPPKSKGSMYVMMSRVQSLENLSFNRPVQKEDIISNAYEIDTDQQYQLFK